VLETRLIEDVHQVRHFFLQGALCHVLAVSLYSILSGCSESRRDPCELLTALEVKSVDSSVSYSLWAGRDGEKKEDEVCMYYTSEGEPKVMLFVWYDKDKVEENSVVVDLPGVGSKAVAAFSESELKLLVVKSTDGVVGLRVRKPVARDSLELLEIVQLAETALSRN
jgi:hypothetical protein